MKIRCIAGYFNNWSRKSKARRWELYFVKRLFFFRLTDVVRFTNICLTKGRQPSNGIKVASAVINNVEFKIKNPPAVTIITAGGLPKTYFYKKLISWILRFYHIAVRP